MVAAFKESVAAGAQLNAVLKSTGGVAGVTAQAATDLASALEKASLFEDEAILSGESLLLTFTNIGKDVFPRATQAMVDMSQALGQDMKSSAIQLGKALNDPITGVTALRRVGVALTEQQEAQIEAMVKAGNVAGAQALILKELETEFGGSAKAASDAAGASEVYKDRMAELSEQIGEKLLPVSEKLNELKLKFVAIIADKVIPILEQLYTKHWPAISKAASNVATMFEEKVIPLLVDMAINTWPKVKQAIDDVAKVFKETLTPAFVGGLDTINPLVQTFFNFILDNKEALITAIGLIGVAIFLALGPASKAAVAITAIVTLIGLIKAAVREALIWLNTLPGVNIPLPNEASGSQPNGPVLPDVPNLPGTGDVGVDTGALFGPGYQHGTPYVPETGWAFLHQGEAVVPAALNRGVYEQLEELVNGQWVRASDAIAGTAHRVVAAAGAAAAAVATTSKVMDAGRAVAEQLVNKYGVAIAAAETFNKYGVAIAPKWGGPLTANAPVYEDFFGGVGAGQQYAKTGRMDRSQATGNGNTSGSYWGADPYSGSGWGGHGASLGLAAGAGYQRDPALTVNVTVMGSVISEGDVGRTVRDILLRGGLQF